MSACSGRFCGRTDYSGIGFLVSEASNLSAMTAVRPVSDHQPDSNSDHDAKRSWQIKYADHDHHRHDAKQWPEEKADVEIRLSLDFEAARLRHIRPLLASGWD